MGPMENWECVLQVGSEEYLMVSEQNDGMMNSEQSVS